MSKINNPAVSDNRDAVAIEAPGQMQTQVAVTSVNTEVKTQVGFNILPVVLFVLVFGAAIYKLYKTR